MGIVIPFYTEFVDDKRDHSQPYVSLEYRTKSKWRAMVVLFNSLLHGCCIREEKHNRDDFCLSQFCDRCPPPPLPLSSFNLDPMIMRGNGFGSFCTVLSVVEGSVCIVNGGLAYLKKWYALHEDTR